MLRRTASMPGTQAMGETPRRYLAQVVPRLARLSLALNELGELAEWADLCRHLERAGTLRELSLAQCPGRGER